MSSAGQKRRRPFVKDKDVSLNSGDAAANQSPPLWFVGIVECKAEDNVLAAECGNGRLRRKT